MGALAAFAGILSLAFLPSGQAGRTGLGLELDVIAATIVGGASLSGGEGTILGTILGVLIIGVMRNGLVLMGVLALRSGIHDRPRHRHRGRHRQMVDAQAGVRRWFQNCPSKGGQTMKLQLSSSSRRSSL